MQFLVLGILATAFSSGVGADHGPGPRIAVHAIVVPTAGVAENARFARAHGLRPVLHAPEGHPCERGFGCRECLEQSVAPAAGQRATGPLAALARSDPRWRAVDGRGCVKDASEERSKKNSPAPIGFHVEVGAAAYDDALARGAIVADTDLASFYARRLALDREAPGAAGAATEAKEAEVGARNRKSGQGASAAPRANRAANGVPDIDSGSMGGHMTLSEMASFVDALAKAYPGVVGPYVSLGCSLEKRHVWAFRLSTLGTGEEVAGAVYPALSDITDLRPCERDGTTNFGGVAAPGILDSDGVTRVTFTGQHHSREPMSTSSLLHFAATLAEREATDPAVQRLLASRELWFVPVVNPDGHAANELSNPGGGGMQRKNMRAAACPTLPGIDINRNYGYKWGIDDSGSSGSPCSNTYRGTTAFSEPETRAVRDLVLTFRPRFNFNFHSYGNMLMYPYGYAEGAYPEDPSERFMFEEYVAGMTRYNGFAVGTGWSVAGLYLTNGEADDWTYGAEGVFALTSELGSTSDGFWPVRGRIRAIADDAFFMMWHLAWRAGPVYNATNLDLVVAADGAMQISFAVRNTGTSESGGRVSATIKAISGVTIVPATRAATGTATSVVATVAESVPARATALSPVTISVQTSSSLDNPIALEINLSDAQGNSFSTMHEYSVGACPDACGENAHCNYLDRKCTCNQGWTGGSCDTVAVTPDGSMEPLPSVAASSTSAGRLASPFWYPMRTQGSPIAFIISTIVAVAVVLVVC